MEYFPCRVSIMRKQESGPGQSNIFFFESEKQLNRYSRHKQEKMAEFYLIKPVCLSLMFDAELGKKSWFIFFLYFSIANDPLLSIFKANVGK